MEKQKQTVMPHPIRIIISGLVYFILIETGLYFLLSFIYEKLYFAYYNHIAYARIFDVYIDESLLPLSERIFRRNVFIHQLLSEVQRDIQIFKKDLHGYPFWKIRIISISNLDKSDLERLINTLQREKHRLTDDYRTQLCICKDTITLSAFSRSHLL